MWKDWASVRRREREKETDKDRVKETERYVMPSRKKLEKEGSQLGTAKVGGWVSVGWNG